MVDLPRQAGPLRSELLSVSRRLQDCAQFDGSHVKPLDPASDHVSRIQEALRQVGNASISKTENNYGDDTVQAVLNFKSDRSIFTRGTTTVDPIVGINTIRKLDELLAEEDDRKHGRGGGGELGVAATIVPTGIITGDTNSSGFTAARLAHEPGGEWTRRDPTKSVKQMVPVGRERTLIVKGTGGAIVSFSMNEEQAATIVASDDTTVTIRGRAAGNARLIVSVEGFPKVFVAIVVRAEKILPLDVFHLGPSDPGAIAGFQAGFLAALNSVFPEQTNIKFTVGATRSILVMRMDGSNTVIDKGLPLFFSTEIGPTNPSRPTFRFEDLLAEVKNPGAVTLFISPTIRDLESDSIAGRGQLRSKACWFKLGVVVDSNRSTLPAHETGHSLGLQHVTAVRNLTYLMNPVLQKNNLQIPADTLDDLIL